MPIYEFSCESCGEDFEKMTPMHSRDAKIECPKCGSKKTGRKLSLVAVGNAGAATSPQPAGGHVHSGMCGCGKRMGSCQMDRN